MFCNLTAKAVRGALSNLATTVDLELHIVKQKRGETVTTSRRGPHKPLWISIGRKTGDQLRPRIYALWVVALEYLRELKRNVAICNWCSSLLESELFCALICDS